MYRLRYSDVLVLLTMFGKCCVGYNVSYNQPKFAPNATWNNTPEILEITNNESLPRGIFVDIRDSVYVSYVGAQPRASVWSNGSKTSIRNISNNGNQAYSVFATLNGDIYVDSGANGFISKWNINDTYASININTISDACYGLFVDINETIYCSIRAKYQVIKRSLKDASSAWIQAGGNGSKIVSPGNLRSPHGIFVDVDFTLYVADCGNNIIQQFRPNSTKGIVTQTDSTLDCPTDVVLDVDNNMYIVDNGKSRIVRILLNSSDIQCLVGCSDSITLNKSIGLSFDSIGNMYVTDSSNLRVLKFLLINLPDTTTTEIPATTTGIAATTEVPAPTTGIPATTTGIATTTIEDVLSTAQSVSDESTSMNQLATIAYYSTKQTFSPSTSEIIPSTSIALTMGTSNSDEFSSSATFAHSSSPNKIKYSTNNSFNLCELLKPCQNSGNCTINSASSVGYHCLCATGYTGIRCEHNLSPCQSYPCLYQGTCNATNVTHFHCLCTSERTGFRCEYLIHRCQPSTCLNKGVCQPMPIGYKCRCLTDDYWGNHCEHVSNRLLVRQYISKGVGYVAILAFVATIIFVIAMDALKYLFGIDLVRRERDEVRRGRALLERRNRKKRRRRGTSCC